MLSEIRLLTPPDFSRTGNCMCIGKSYQVKDRSYIYLVVSGWELPPYAPWPN